MTAAHIAVVPVSRLDDSTRDALEYASQLASEVLAIHIRDVDSQATQLESNWRQHVAQYSLCIVETDSHGWRDPLRHAVETLKQQGQRVSVVFPPGKKAQRFRPGM